MSHLNPAANHRRVFFQKLYMQLTRRERRAAIKDFERSTHKLSDAMNVFEREMRKTRREFFTKYNIDFDALLRQTAEARRAGNLCEHDDDVVNFTPADAHQVDELPVVVCNQCNRSRLRIPLITPILISEIEADEEGLAAFMTRLFF